MLLPPISKLRILVLSTFFATASAGAATPACKASRAKVQIPELASEFPEIQKKLNRGLTVTLVHQMPFGEWKCSLLLDLWEEVYEVNTGWAGKEPHKVKTKKLAEAMTLCAEFELLSNMNMPKKFEVVSVLDPVSEEQMARTRKWLAERGIGKGSSAIVGRAVGAILDLKDNRTVVRTCSSDR